MGVRMSVFFHNDQLEHNENVSSVVDASDCDEGKWEEKEEGELTEESDVTTNNDGVLHLDTSSLCPLLLLEQDLFWEDEELNSLFSKEKVQQETYYDLKDVNFDSCLSQPRREAVEWMLKVNSHYGFSALTATLAVTYLDMFLLSFHFQRKKPWMIQLVAVTCISLAAKVEETPVPLLLDLQVQDAKYVFEAKTIQRMELLVLSTLKWKMHTVTPLSFLDHMIRRLGLKTHLHLEFLRHCEHLLLSVLLDSRFVGVLPSVLATATMLHVIGTVFWQRKLPSPGFLVEVVGHDKDDVFSDGEAEHIVSSRRKQTRAPSEAVETVTNATRESESKKQKFKSDCKFNTCNRTRFFWKYLCANSKCW